MKMTLVAVKIILIIVIMVSVGSVLGAIGYVASIKNNPPVAVQPTPTITQILTPIVTSTLTPTASNIDISGWKTYKNEEYGYELKYPASWEEKTTGIENPVSGSGILFITGINEQGLPLDNWIKENSVVEGRGTRLFSANPVYINGVKVYKSEDPELEKLGPPYPVFELYSSDKNNNIFGLQAGVSENPDPEDGIILKQVLLTIKFTETDNTKDWETYRNEKSGFEIKYPSDILILSNKDTGTVMTHSVNYKHPDPCDFKGDGPDLNKITDFNITLEIFNKNLEEIIKEKAGNYVSDNFLKNGKIEISPGFIDEVRIGSLTGYKITSGVEGCGEYIYYLSLGNRSLIIQRSFVSELIAPIYDREKYLKLPGIITPGKEEEIFNQIISTFKFIDEINQVYKLDCTDKLDSFQSKYSWYKDFNNQIDKDWEMDTICYNEDLKNAIYFIHYLKGQHFSDELVKIGIYDVKNNINNNKLEIKESQCRKVIRWSKNSDIFYECDSSGPAVVSISTYLYNTNTKNNKLIDSCGIGNNDTNYLKTCEDERKKEYFNNINKY